MLKLMAKYCDSIKILHFEKINLNFNEGIDLVCNLIDRFNKNLNSLTLSWCGLTNKSLNKLSEILLDYPHNLKFLDLSYNTLNKED